MKIKNKPTISTIKEKCRVCYSCVRGCPAKAISIVQGQAEIISDRCITCGNCVRVCSQKAKQVRSSIEDVSALLSTAKKSTNATITSSSKKVFALIAPSFPANYSGITHLQLCGALRELGFDRVFEVGFGADLVAQAYKKLIEDNVSTQKSYIATTCPAIVSYVEKYHPELIDNLAPIVSPMIAMARVVKELYGENNSLVFIGPCIAKKDEIERESLATSLSTSSSPSKDKKCEIDQVLTFRELDSLFENSNINPKKSIPADFDPPLAQVGGIFPITKGLLQTASITEDLVAGNIVTADGKENFPEALKEFSRGYLNSTKLLETLSCNGCIMGPGISYDLPIYQKKKLIQTYVYNRTQNCSTDEKIIHQRYLAQFKNIDLKTSFNTDSQIMPLPSWKEIKRVLKELGKGSIEDELNCGACGYETCVDHAVAILKGLAENEMCLPYTIDKLKGAIQTAEKSYDELKSVKEALNHREKLASMGQLSAGIAHEVNNPLGIVLMYAHMLNERDLSSLQSNDKIHEKIKEEMKEEIQMIVEQANRCKKIVSGLLNFSRQTKVFKEKVNLLDLAKHCMESLHIPATIKTSVFKENANTETCAELDRDQISQVLINLINNSADALESTPSGGTINVVIGGDNHNIFIRIEDNGPGIKQEHMNRIFDPFFTTKQMGKGTGLGLPVCYGIIKMHRGQIDVKSNADTASGSTGTIITVTLPKDEERHF